MCFCRNERTDVNQRHGGEVRETTLCDVLHVYVLASVILQTTEDTGCCDRSDRAASVKTEDWRVK
jgi:hypothetical protein